MQVYRYPRKNAASAIESPFTEAESPRLWREMSPVAAKRLALIIAVASAVPTDTPTLRTIDRNAEPTPSRFEGMELIKELLFGV